jgi:hypothetical protein
MVDQVPGFRRQKFGYMHRIDRFFHGIPTPPVALTEERGQRRIVLHFFHVAAPPPLAVGLFFMHDNLDGTCSGGAVIASVQSFSRRRLFSRQARGGMVQSFCWLRLFSRHAWLGAKTGRTGGDALL